MLGSSAAEADFILAFDLDSAFLNAELERNIFCRLPKVWAEKHGHEIVKLKKALYGLKDAPKAWYLKYNTILRGLGWEPCESAPGLWRKQSKIHPTKFLKMSVYVDDNIIAGPDLDEVKSELQEIF